MMKKRPTIVVIYTFRFFLFPSKMTHYLAMTPNNAAETSIFRRSWVYLLERTRQIALRAASLRASRNNDTMSEKQKRLLFLCAHRSVRELMAASRHHAVCCVIISVEQASRKKRGIHLLAETQSMTTEAITFPRAFPKKTLPN